MHLKFVIENHFLKSGINKTDKTSSFATIPKSRNFSFLEAIDEIKALSTFLFKFIVYI